MEKIDLQKEDLLQDEVLKIEETSSYHLKEVALWSRVIGILCIVLFAGSLLLAIAYNLLGYFLLDGIISFALIAFLLFMGIIVYHLIQLGNNLRKAIDGQDQDTFEKGTRNLKILMVIFCVLSILQLLYTVIKELN